MIQVDSIEELSTYAKKTEGDSWLLVSQSETYPAGFTLGDEDSSPGNTLKMKMQLLLETPDKNYYFTNQYEDEEIYKEAVNMMEELMQEVKSQTVEQAVIEARLHQN
jgi:hypothetical protein